MTRNQDTAKTVESVRDFTPVVIGDLAGGLQHPDAFRIPFRHDFSAARNTLASKVETPWILWLDPGEVVVSGHEFLAAEKPDMMYRVMVINDDMLTKQPRIVRKEARFKRPVFEGVDDLSEQTLPVVVTGGFLPDDADITEGLLRWRDKEPLLPEIDYYESCLHLMHGRMKNFLTSAEKFLFNSKTQDVSVIVTKYYLASFFKKTNPGKALKLILECLSAYPLMAEYWCLLGDIYLMSLKEYDRAYIFYENAVILGSQRLAEDVMPMEVSKYDEYPRKRMEMIRGAIHKTLSFSGGSPEKQS